MSLAISPCSRNLSNILAECFGDLIIRDMVHVASTADNQLCFRNAAIDTSISASPSAEDPQHYHLESTLRVIYSKSLFFLIIETRACYRSCGREHLTDTIPGCVRQPRSQSD